MAYKRSKRRKGRKELSGEKLTPENIKDVVTEAVADSVEDIVYDIADIKRKMDDEETMEVTKSDMDDLGVDSAEELIEIIDDGVEIAVETLEDEGDELASEVADQEIDVQEVVDIILKHRRKMKRRTKSDLDPITPEDVADVVEEIAIEVADEIEEEIKSDNEDEDYKMEEEEKEEEEEEEKNEDETKKSRRRSSRGRKSAVSSRRASTPRVNRQYKNIYGGNFSGRTNRQEKKEPMTPGQFGRLVKCADYYARGGTSGGFADPGRASHYAEKVYKDTKMARAFKAMENTSSITQSESGGLLIPEVYHDEIAPLLYAKTVIMEAGAQRMAMPHGNLNMIKQTEGSRATWGGEDREIDVSGVGFGELRLSSKRLQAMVVVTNEMLRSTDYSVDTIYGNDLLRKMRLGLDFGGLKGDGQEFSPLGVMNNPDIEIIDLTKINDTHLADTDGRPQDELPIYARGIVLGKDVEGDSLGWIFNVDVEHYFMRMKYPGTGEFVWREEMLTSGTLAGYPYFTTSQLKTVPTTGFAEMIFGNWSDLIVGEQFGLETLTSNEATINLGGKQHSNFQRVTTTTRATQYADMGVRYDEAFVNIRNVKVREAII